MPTSTANKIPPYRADITHPSPVRSPWLNKTPVRHYPLLGALEGPKTRSGFSALASWLVNSLIGGAPREEWENVTAGMGRSGRCGRVWMG